MWSQLFWALNEEIDGSEKVTVSLTPDAMSVLLDRGKSHPFTLDVFASADSTAAALIWDKLVAVVVPHVSRIAALDMNATGRVAKRVSRFLSKAGSHFPQLRSLRFSNPFNPYERGPSEVSHRPLRAPLLRFIQLSQAGFSVVDSQHDTTIRNTSQYITNFCRRAL